MVRPVVKCQAILYSNQEIAQTKDRGIERCKAPPLETTLLFSELKCHHEITGTSQYLQPNVVL